MKVFYNKENKGVSAARNIGLDNATGEWITFVDADDYLTRGDAYDIAMSTKEEGTDILGWHYRIERENGEFDRGSFNPKQQVCEGKDKAHLFDYSSREWFSAVWCYLYRSEMLKDNEIRFDEDLKFLEDFEFNMLAFIMARKIKFIDYVLYNYRDVGNSLSKRMDLSNFDTYFMAFQDIFEFCKNKGILENQRLLMLCVNSIFYGSLESLIDDSSYEFYHTLVLLGQYYDKNELQRYRSKGLESVDGCTCKECLKTIEITYKQLGRIFKLAHDS